MKKFLILALLGSIALLCGATLSVPLFDHVQHEDMECDYCHEAVPVGPDWEAPMPQRAVCLDCHDEDELPAQADYPTSHQGDFRYQHQFEARANGGDCAMCHRNSEKCTVCHHADNIDFLTHDRNWQYTHPLTRYKGIEECGACHFTQTFCQDCHAEKGVRPAHHFTAGWNRIHAEQARSDLNSCIQCHGGAEPVCRDCHG